MGNYFDYKDYEIEEITNSLREDIESARTPLPEKIMKHFICIRYKVGENCYSLTNNDWMWMHREFIDREDAINYMEKIDWIKRIGDNMWVYKSNNDTYRDKNGNNIPFHYEIDEYDNEVYEDGEYHKEYTKEEIEDLSNALHCIEMARVYLREYDNAINNGSVGGGGFHEKLHSALKKFEEEYSESLPENYYENKE